MVTQKFSFWPIYVSDNIGRKKKTNETRVLQVYLLTDSHPEDGFEHLREPGQTPGSSDKKADAGA